MSFQQGISGLNAASRNLEVIGNNIANANTVGAKVSRAEFADMYANAATLETSNGTGMGVRVAAVTQQFTQGGIRSTSNPLDVAINGSGFFQVAKPGGSDVGFTRNGEFQMDNLGYVVTTAGMQLHGYAVDPTTGRTGGVSGPILLPTTGIAPRVTTDVATQLNLDGRVGPPAAGAAPFTLTDTSSFASSTSASVFDQQGNEQVLSLFFRRTATNNEWEVYAGLNGQPVPAPATGATQLPVGRLTFKPDGSLDAAASGTLSDTGAFTAGKVGLALPFSASTLPLVGATPATGAPVTLDFGSSTQWGAMFGVNRIAQDGYSAGQLTGFAITGDGSIEARYSNGKTVSAAKIALADFRNPQGLSAVGGNLYRATPASGQAAVGAPGSANLGLLQGGALEESNIDITQQLVAMIEAQRAYQANAQAIKTQDQVQASVVNLR